MANRTNKSLRAGWASVPALISCLALNACVEGGPEAELELETTGLRGLELGLELHWSFEDSVGTQITDISGKGRHGTLQGGQLVSSPLGQAVSLDGIDDYISLVGPRSPALYGGPDGSFTFSALVRVPDVGRSNTLCFGCGPFATMYVGNESFGPVVLAAVDDQSGPGRRWVQSAPGLVADQWTQVTFVVEDGSSARYYLDCQLSGELNDPNIGLDDPGYSAVGQSANANRWFEGEIDELRIWNRALSGAELAQLCPAPDPLEQGLELHWTFEDRVGDQVLDVSGNGRHGTSIGGVFVNSPRGQALSLDGLDDKVSFVGPRALSLYGGAEGDFSLSARVRVADVNKYNTLCFGCGPFTTMHIGDTVAGGRILSNLYNLDTQTNLSTASSSVLSNDEWAEVTLVVEGGVAARTYHNCNLDTTLTGANIGLRDPGYSAIGESSNANRWYQGQIDELRVWSRALPESELAQLCAQPSCGPIFVDVQAPPGGDGSSWASAYDTVQGAIGAASASACPSPELWVAEGVYAPDPALPVATISAPVAIYGGFAGVEDSLEQRDIAAHPVRFGANGWQARVVEIKAGAAHELGSTRLDGVRISGSAAGAIRAELGPADTGTLVLDTLTITNNSHSSQGAGLLSLGGNVVISNSSFADNNANLGGAIYLLDRDAGTSLELAQTNFTGNTGKWGGAIYIDDDPALPGYVTLTAVGGEFQANAASSGGGAIYAEESTTSFDSVVFTGNTAVFGGAIQLANASASVVSDALELWSCRFIANLATNGNGGALRLQERGTLAVNTEFVDNQATTVGGAVFGRGEFIASTFANNLAGNSGSALFANAGDPMTMRHCVAFPDTIVGADISAPYSCVNSNTPGSPQIQLGGVSPFAPADLDGDGRTEFYLLPGSPCVGLEGGVIEEFEWTSLTVDQSQCTDSGWPEPGVHYVPQSAAGVCE